MAGAPVAVTARWAASVGFTDDGRPLCTLADEGVVAVGGYNGTGNLVGPVAARAAVALAVDGTPPPAWLAS
jgi:glycine/D-amino acid oxidase-like deaminating enzyme